MGEPGEEPRPVEFDYLIALDTREARDVVALALDLGVVTEVLLNLRELLRNRDCGSLSFRCRDALTAELRRGGGVGSLRVPRGGPHPLSSHHECQPQIPPNEDFLQFPQVRGDRFVLGASRP